MNRNLLVGYGLLVIAALGMFVSIALVTDLITPPVDAPTPTMELPSTLEVPIAPVDDVTARYHQRKRTARFFKRSRTC